MPTTHEKIRELVNVALNRGPAFNVIDTWLDSRPAAVVIDIGTNIGGFIPHWLEKGASRIHAFEPVPAVFAKLQATYGLHPSVVLNRTAIGEVSGTVTGVQILNTHTLANPRDCKLAVALEDTGAFDMQVTSLDRYTMFHIPSTARIDLIKLDVDGYEPKALRGMVMTLARWRPFVMIELSFLPFRMGDSIEAMIRHIYDMKYTLVTMSGEVCEDPIWVLEAFPWRTSTDMVMVPNEHLNPAWPKLR